MPPTLPPTLRTDFASLTALYSSPDGEFLDGWVGMQGTVSGWKNSAGNVKFVVEYGDEEGEDRRLEVEWKLRDYKIYPSSYNLTITLPDPPRRLPLTIRSSLNTPLDLTIPLASVLSTMLRALQGDETALLSDAGKGKGKVPAVAVKKSGKEGEPINVDSEEDEAMEDEEEGEEEEGEEEYFEEYDASWGGEEGNGWNVDLETSMGLREDKRVDWAKLKEDFALIQSYGYRPGFQRVSGVNIVLSVSIPLAELFTSPQELAIWDDALASAYTTKRLILLAQIGDEYPPRLMPGVGVEGGIGSAGGWKRGSAIKFWVGLGENYKPSFDSVKDITRIFTAKPDSKEIKKAAPHDFQSFLLSDSLASHMNRSFINVANIRLRNPAWSWKECEEWVATREVKGMSEDFEDDDGEKLNAEGKSKKVHIDFSGNFSAGELMSLAVLKRKKTTSHTEHGVSEDRLQDPYQDAQNPKAANNFGLVAMTYLARRVQMGAEYCMNCGYRLEEESLRPTVCSNALCVFALHSLGLGLNVEHSIRTNAAVVDLLLSFAYLACVDDARMDLPIGLHIMVPCNVLGPGVAAFKDDGSGLFAFDDVPEADDLGQGQGQASTQKKVIAQLLLRLPRVSAMKKGLLAGKALRATGPETPSGSWEVLRWVLSSCKAYLREVNSDEYAVGLDKDRYRQFKFAVDSPAHEIRFKSEITKAQSRHQKCQLYPTILAFHGSSAERWHNIVRKGLDFQEIANARAYGHGVYFATDGNISMSSYARPAKHVKSNADLHVRSATAIVELVNAVSEFVSSNPFLVVKETSWMKSRLLLVEMNPATEDSPIDVLPQPVLDTPAAYWVQDPSVPFRLNSKTINIAQPAKADKETFIDTEEYMAEDKGILEPEASKPVIKQYKPTLNQRMDRLGIMPPPTETSSQATKALSKEFKALVKQQEVEEMPFYIDPEAESLYQYIMELHTFPPESALAKDMKKYKVQSIIIEARFGASYPFAPPFIRVLHPRMLNFKAGGGGHITIGGSICHELLTMTGWSPAYCLQGVLIDIMTNMTVDPPARLDPRRWDVPYSPDEAMEAYKRVAMEHGWSIPPGMEKLFR